MPTGKPANLLAKDGHIFNRKFTEQLLEHNHSFWKRLIGGFYDLEPTKKDGIALQHTTLKNHDSLKISKEEANAEVTNETHPFNSTPPNDIDQTEIDRIHFVDRMLIICNYFNRTIP
jgi:hypothetical protein